MMTMLLVSAPVLLVGLVIGLLISIFQTLTHIQEMTLTFIPKITAVFAVRSADFEQVGKIIREQNRKPQIDRATAQIV